MTGQPRAILSLIAAAVALALPATASALPWPTLYLDGGHVAEREDEWALMSAIPTTDEAIRISRAPCPFAKPDESPRSCATRWRGEWRIWLSPAEVDPWDRWTFYHELFHVRDRASGPRLNRIRSELRRINQWWGPWRDAGWPSSWHDVPASPAERAADAAAWCGFIPRSLWASIDPAVVLAENPSYLWQPTRAQFVATCDLLRSRR